MGWFYGFNLTNHQPRIQLASTTVGLMPKKTSLGVLKPKRFRGRLLSLSTTTWISSSVMSSRRSRQSTIEGRCSMHTRLRNWPRRRL